MTRALPVPWSLLLRDGLAALPPCAWTGQRVSPTKALDEANREWPSLLASVGVPLMMESVCEGAWERSMKDNPSEEFWVSHEEGLPWNVRCMFRLIAWVACSEEWKGVPFHAVLERLSDESPLGTADAEQLAMSWAEQFLEWLRSGRESSHPPTVAAATAANETEDGHVALADAISSESELLLRSAGQVWRVA